MINTDIFTIDKINKMNENSLVSHLNIKIINVGSDFIEATMPVDNTTKQPHGILHGGASVVLAETLGSLASNMSIDYNKQYAVGLEVNANHLKSVSEGYVRGIAKPIKLGKSIHVWEIKIYNQNDDITCISRLTMYILNKN